MAIEITKINLKMLTLCFGILAKMLKKKIFSLNLAIKISSQEILEMSCDFVLIKVLISSKYPATLFI